MSRLSQHGGFNEEAIEKAKAELAETLEFSEQQEPLARNGAGYPSTSGFIEQHFNFEEGTLDFARCQRPDGSYYGTGGVCRKGAPAGAKEKEAVAPAPKKTTSKDPVKGVLKEQQATKDFLKKDSKELAKNPELVKRTAVAKIRKLSNEYERLRGDAQAGGRRREIIDEVNKLAKVQARANDQIERNKRAADGPKKPDTSLPAQQRRSSAAARARD